MGLSASQARLLSITARLTNNEYQSQQITNAKMRLASTSNEARKEYQDALNSTQLIYNGFDTYGNSTQTAFTPNIIYQYQPLKNQYALTNSAGQALVNSTDAKNFEQSENILDFIGRYGVLDGYSDKYAEYQNQKQQYEIDKENYEPQKEAYNKYLQDLDEYNQSVKAHDRWQELNNQWIEHNNYLQMLDENGITYEELCAMHEKYNTWEANVQVKEAFWNNFTSAFETETSRKNPLFHNYLEDIFNYSQTETDYGDAVDYMNTILVTMLNYKDSSLNASDGDISDRAYDDIRYKTSASSLPEFHVTGNKGIIFNSDENKIAALKYISENMENIYCDGNDFSANDLSGSTGEKYNLIEAAIEDHGNPTSTEIVISDYVYDPDTNSCAKDENGNYKVKTLYQKAIDLLWLNKNDSNIWIIPETLKADWVHTSVIGDSNSMKHWFRPLIYKSFILDDVRFYNEPEPEKPTIGLDPYPYATDPGEEPTVIEEPEKVEEPKEPVMPEEPEFYIDDKEKAQWYINLWCRMNGEKESPRIQTTEGYRDNIEYYKIDSVDMLDIKKNEKAQNYRVLDPNLAQSTTWLEDVLSQGIVTLQRIENDTLTGDKKYLWNDIIYTNAAELTTQTDDNAIAKAEVRYEEKMKEIEAKDKRYQLKINKLDSEHNALQQQIDSIKGEISKNIDRSYKTFG